MKKLETRRLKGMIATSLILISFLCGYQSTDDLTKYIVGSLNSFDQSLSKNKLDVKEILRPMLFFEDGLVSCLNLDDGFKPVDKNVDIKFDEMDTVRIDSKHSKSNWSKDFRKQIKGRTRPKIEMSDVLRIGKDLYLIGYQDVHSIWIELIYKDDNGDFKNCNVTSIANH